MLESIMIRNWKLHENLNFKFKSGLNFIIGPNAIGKTSLLEAIYYAITGDLRRSSLNKVRRIGASEPTLIRLEMIHNSEKLSIERKFDEKSSKHSLFTQFEVYHKKSDIENKILSLFHTKRVFLKRMVYFGEGDIFRGFSYPRRKFNFKEYIEGLIGIQQLKEFNVDIKELQAFYRKEGKKLDILIEDLITDTLETVPTERISIFSQKKDEKSRELIKVEKILSNLKREYNSLSIKIKKFEDLEDAFRTILNLKVFDVDILNINTQLGLDLVKLKKKREESLKKIQKLDFKKEELDKELRILDKIFGVLKDLEKIYYDMDINQQPCPICNKTFKSNEYEEIYREKADLFRNLKSNFDKIKSQTSDLKNEQNDIEDELNRKDYLFNKIQEYLPDWKVNIKKYKVMKEHFDEIKYQIQVNLKKKYDLTNEIDEINDKIYKMARKEAKKRDLDPSYIQDKKQNIKYSLYLIDILQEVIGRILYKVKLDYLHPLTQEITEIWRKLFNDQDRFVSFDEKLNPILKNDQGEIGFEGLSGGEKTILTIITKTLIMHHFSNLNFVIMDEPLEHLDVENRAQIIEYLKRIHEVGLIKQLIITTFEESLTRDLFEDEAVKIIPLSALKKYPFISKRI